MMDTIILLYLGMVQLFHAWFSVERHHQQQRHLGKLPVSGTAKNQLQKRWSSQHMFTYSYHRPSVKMLTYTHAWERINEIYTFMLNNLNRHRKVSAHKKGRSWCRPRERERVQKNKALSWFQENSLLDQLGLVGTQLLADEFTRASAALLKLLLNHVGFPIVHEHLEGWIEGGGQRGASIMRPNSFNQKHDVPNVFYRNASILK